MGILSDGWTGYANECVPAPPTSTQYDETRKAFYAGAVMVIGTMRKGIATGASSKQTADAVLTIEKEVLAFYEEIKQRLEQSRRRHEGNQKGSS